ncbi:MAG: glycosyltransferase [Pseudomonadota bacterium]
MINQKNQDNLKIAMLGSFPPLRGLSSYCLELALSVADLTDIEFISFKKLYPAFMYPGGDLKEDNTFPVPHHPNLKIKRRLTWYNPLTWLKEGMFGNGDLLHAQWWSLPLFPVYLIILSFFKIRCRPIVITVHNVVDHEKSYTYKKFSGLLFKLADHLIVHTAKNKEQMITEYGISPDKLSLIPHGSLDFHVKYNIDREEIRKELGFDIKNKIILLFGAIRPYKGVDTALKAFAQVLAKVPDSRLLIAGKLWEKWEPYQKLIEKLNIEEYISTYLDYIPSGEVYRFFTASDIVILPYHHFDSQSGVGATAVSFRKPLIVTDVGGLPDLVCDRRFIVKPNDESSLASAIIGCINDPEKLKTMANASDTIIEQLAWPEIAKKTYSIYNQLLGF